MWVEAWAPGRFPSRRKRAGTPRREKKSIQRPKERGEKPAAGASGKERREGGRERRGHRGTEEDGTSDSWRSGGEWTSEKEAHPSLLLSCREGPGLSEGHQVPLARLILVGRKLIWNQKYRGLQGVKKKTKL